MQNTITKATNYDAIPAELKACPQWVDWRYETRDGKLTKVPYQPNGKRAKSTQAATWSTFDDVKAAAANYAGVGFVFSKDDSYVGIDLDDCRDEATGIVEPWAAAIVDKLNSYAEVSPSKTGIKIWVRGELPGNGTGKKAAYETGAVEMYQHGRYFTVTGEVYGEPRPVVDCSEAIDEIWRQVFGDVVTSEVGEVVADPPSHATAEVVAEFLPRLLALPKSIEGENGSADSVHAGCEIRRAGIYGDAGRKLLDLYNEHRCEPPWKEWELDRIWEAARKRVPPAGSEFEDLGEAVPAASKKLTTPYRQFPVAVLPEPLAAFVVAASTSIGCDPAFVVLPLLTCLAAAIGNSVVLRLKPGWDVPSILWTIIVGESGTAKSPSSHLATRPVFRLEHEALARHAEQMQRFEGELDRYKGWKSSVDDPTRPMKPEPPQAERFVVSDTTVEALTPILAANPRGVLLVRDELAGWFGGFDRYASGGGSDEAHWLSMYHANRLLVDRKTGTQKTIYVPRANVSITGGIQPGVLQRALGVERRESGLAARFLMACPPRKPKQWATGGIDAAIESQVFDLVRRLYTLEPESPNTPTVATLSPEAMALWIEFYNRHAQELGGLVGELASAYSKLEETAARLTLIVHYTKWAATPIVDEATAWGAMFDGDQPMPGGAKVLTPHVIDASSVAAAVEMVEWFKAETARVYGLLSESGDQAATRKLVEWIGSRGGAVTARELQRGYWALRDKGAAEAALQQLAAKGYGSWEAMAPGRRGGRPKQAFILDGTSTNPEAREVSSSVEADE